MGRYSPTVREDPGGPLDFSPLTSALRQMQDNRLRRRQLSLYEDREAEDRRVQGERERVAHEARVNDVRARGGVPILSAPVGQPTLRDMTPATENAGARALGGQPLRPMLASRASTVPAAEYRPDGTGRYLETLDGESYMVDPMQPARLQDTLRDTSGRALRASQGRVARTLLKGTPQFAGALDALSDEDLGRMPLGEVDGLIRAAQPKKIDPRDDIEGQARALGVNVAGMSPGEAAQRVAMAERNWNNTHRAPPQVDPVMNEQRALLRDERVARGKADFADRMVQAFGGAVKNEKGWRPADLAEAKRLGMSLSDYRAAEQRYHDKRNPARASGGVSDIIAKALADDEEAGEAPAMQSPTEERRETGGKTPTAAQRARAAADPDYAAFLREQGYKL